MEHTDREARLSTAQPTCTLQVAKNSLLPDVQPEAFNELRSDPIGTTILPKLFPELQSTDEFVSDDCGGLHERRGKGH